MEEVAQEIVGQCPHCGAEVGYEDWVAIEGEDGVMGCPECKTTAHVDEVFPPLAVPQKQPLGISQAAVA